MEERQAPRPRKCSPMKAILCKLYPELYDKKNLNKLKSYSYNAVDKSYLSQVLNPYWEWVTSLMPKWLAYYQTCSSQVTSFVFL